MHIFFNGCSFTWGDQLENRLEERFSTLVANHYQAEHVNISDRGRSNDAIVRTTMEWFANGNTTDLAVIQWTIISRFEGYDELKKNYIHVTVDKKSKWDHFYRKYYYDQLGVDCLFKNYYLLEQFFIRQNIKYLFVFHDYWDLSNNETILNTNSVWKNFIIKKDFPVICGRGVPNDSILGTDPINYQSAGGHPSSTGHQLIANYIIDQFSNDQLD